MSKKIIAILLVFTLVITCFVACRKEKPETVKINGEDCVVVTDDEGNTVFNEDGDVAVHILDNEGNILYFDNGEPQTRYIEVPEYYNRTKITGDSYEFELGEGWEYKNISNLYEKEGSDGKAVIKVSQYEYPENCSTVDEYLTATKESNKELIDDIKEKYDYNEKITEISFLNDNKDAREVELIVKDDNGNMVSYTYSIYFEFNGKIVVTSYNCHSGYYEEIDALTIFKEAFSSK